MHSFETCAAGFSEEQNTLWFPNIKTSKFRLAAIRTQYDDPIRNGSA